MSREKELPDSPRSFWRCVTDASKHLRHYPIDSEGGDIKKFCVCPNSDIIILWGERSMIWPTTYFLNEVVLEHSYAHVFAYCSCASTAELNSCDKHHHVAYESLEHVLPGLLQKCFFQPGIQK